MKPMKIAIIGFGKIAADQHDWAKAHGPDDRAVAIHRNLDRINRQRARDAVDPCDGKAAHGGQP